MNNHKLVNHAIFTGAGAINLQPHFTHFDIAADKLKAAGVLPAATSAPPSDSRQTQQNGCVFAPAFQRAVKIFYPLPG